MSAADKGYSLIEMLATLLILGSVFLLLVSGIATTHRVWERADSRGSSEDAIVGAENLLRTRFEHAFPQTRYDASAPYVDFKGGADNVSFLSTPAGNQELRGVRRYSLTVSEQGDLVLDSTNDPSDAAPTRDVLLHGVESIAISYYGPLPTAAGMAWQSRWESEPKLPRLVKVQVQFASGDHRTWPELIAHPASTIDSLCVLDRRLGKCRGRA